MQTLGCNRSWASVFIIYHVTTQTDLLCYQPYQLLAQLRAKEAQISTELKIQLADDAKVNGKILFSDNKDHQVSRNQEL